MSKEKPMFRAVLLAILALLVVACGEGSTTAELSMVVVETVQPAEQDPKVSAEPVADQAPTQVVQAGGDRVDSDQGDDSLNKGPVSIGPPSVPGGLRTWHETISWSDVIARVRLESSTTVVEAYNPVDGSPTEYHVGFLLTFDVLEYIEGAGGDDLDALVVGDIPYRTEADARAALPDYPPRDTKWDDREALVFLSKLTSYPSTTTIERRYFLGHWHIMTRGDGYTVASNFARLWLPDAAAPSNSGGASGGAGGASGGNAASATSTQKFLLEDPAAAGAAGGASGGAGGAAGAASSKTLALAELRGAIATIKAEIAAGDGSDDYEDCVSIKYMKIREWDDAREKTGTLTAAFSGQSGQPALTALVFESDNVVGVLHYDDLGVGYMPDTYGRRWIEGPASDYLTVREIGKTPDYLRADKPSGDPPDIFLFTNKIAMTRPLPAGEYVFHYNRMGPGRTICNLQDERERNAVTSTATVTAPDGTKAEALFDPSALDGVSATSTARLYVAPDAPTSTAIGPIKWTNGTLKIGLSPVAGFSGHHLDFIAADGTLAHTAAVDAATRTGDTLSWPVQAAPWGAGDKMMVRLYREVSSTCTVAERAMKPGACY